MSNDEILEYGFKNYENFNYEEDKEIAEKFVEIFVNDELYKKNRDYKQLKAFIYIYGNLRMREMGVITNIVTVDPGTSKRKYKITRFFDRQGYDKYLNGSCNEERIKVQLTNYLIRSLQMSDKANFARLINTINHELKHARCYKDIDFYNKIVTKQNYDNLKFNLFGGYIKNFGMGKALVPIVSPDGKAENNLYTRSNVSNIDCIYRISPAISYTMKRMTFGIEYEWTAVSYGDGYNDFAEVEGIRTIANNRICGLVRYSW
jgi:hypothetical protein